MFRLRYCHEVLTGQNEGKYLRRSRVRRAGEQLVICKLCTHRDALRRTRAVVDVELAVRIGCHGEQFKKRKPILSQFHHTELDEAVSVINDTSLKTQKQQVLRNKHIIQAAYMSQQTHMNLKLPTAYGLICQDFSEGDRQAITKEPLACLAPHIKPCMTPDKL